MILKTMDKWIKTSDDDKGLDIVNKKEHRSFPLLIQEQLRNSVALQNTKDRDQCGLGNCDTDRLLKPPLWLHGDDKLHHRANYETGYQ